WEPTCLWVPVSAPADVASSEQLAARDYWVELGEGDRQRRLPGRYARVSAEAFEFRRPAPRVGEHTAEFSAEWLAEPSPEVAGRRPAPTAARPQVAAPAPLAGLKVLDL